MARYHLSRLLTNSWFISAICPPPALDVDTVAGDALAFMLPFRFPVESLFSRAGFQPGHTAGIGAVSVFAAFDAGRQCVHRVWVLEKRTQGAGLADGVQAHAAGATADTTTCIGDTGGEDVSVRLEVCEEAFGFFGDEVVRGCSQPVELRTDFVRDDFGQLIDVPFLEPEMRIAEAGWGGGELVSAERCTEGAYDACVHGRVGGERKYLREGGDLGWLQGGMTGWWTAPEEAACGAQEAGGGG